LCGHQIRWYENIPVLSWLALRGRCSGCKAPISIQYPLVELLTGFLFLMAYIEWNLSIDLLFILIYLALLIVIAGIDIKAQIVPHVLTIPGMALGLFYAYLSPRGDLLYALAGLGIGAGTLLLVIVAFYLVTRKIGMGGGDVMILGMIGSYLGPAKLAPVLFIASVGGILFFFVMRLFTKEPRIAGSVTVEDIKGSEKDLERVIYFGPFLALGGAVMLFVSDDTIIRLLTF
jgi:leader peptidase (prepilin peptidase)/N-methyltransferase